MRTVCEVYGPDHILYPEVSGQPFFRYWLQDNHIIDLPNGFDMSGKVVEEAETVQVKESSPGPSDTQPSVQVNADDDPFMDCL